MRQFNLWNERPDFISRWQWFICCLIGVAGELVDLDVLIEKIPRIYDHITGGRMSKCTYTAEAVIDQADDYMQRCIDDAIKEEREIASHGGFVEPNPEVGKE